MMRQVFTFGVALMMVVAAGCSKPGTAPTTKVTGTVNLDGTPIEGVTVTFMPAEGRQASATTDASGKFTLSTFESGDGAVEGSHKVAIGEPPAENEPMPGTPEAENWTPPKPRFPETYADFGKSGFTAEVKSGEANDFTFDMTSK